MLLPSARLGLGACTHTRVTAPLVWYPRGGLSTCADPRRSGEAIPNMSASPESHAPPPAPARHIAFWERLVQRFGAGDPWQAGFLLIGVLLLLLDFIATIIASA